MKYQLLKNRLELVDRTTIYRWVLVMLASTGCLTACQVKDVPQPVNAPASVSQAAAAAPATNAIAPLTDSQVKALYQNCPSGYYSGPRPGKTWVTKDNFIWTVTPAFAARFCMPPEFISTELKGAQAVAFQLIRDNSEMNCGLAVIAKPVAAKWIYALKFILIVR
jgi:hypothetical protein